MDMLDLTVHLARLRRAEAPTVTTSQVLTARGVSSRKVLWRDLDAGLFRGVEPERHSPTPRRFAEGSRAGNPLVWPHAALMRARQIAEYLRRGWTRGEVAKQIVSGHLMPPT